MIKVSSLLGLIGRKGESYIKARPFPLDNEIFTRLIEKCPPEIEDDRMCGVEIEVEQCYFLQNADAIRYRAYDKLLSEKLGVSLEELFGYFWWKTNDGSLRNHGIEYVTRIGTTFKFASSAVKALSKFFSLVEKDAEVNARTGLHVHVDVRDLQLIDLQRLLLVYALFEEVLFNYSGARQNNIFCVPIGETDLPLAELKGIKSPEKLKKFVEANCKKYTGLNLAPLMTQGTIEFRMHKGLIDASEINKWLQILSDLVGSVTKPGSYQDFNELAELIPRLMKDDLYNHFFRSVFPKSYSYLLPFVTKDAIEKGVSTAKELLLDSSSIPDEYKLKPAKSKNRQARWEDVRAILADPPLQPEDDDIDDGVPQPVAGVLDGRALERLVEGRMRAFNGNFYIPRISSLNADNRTLIDAFLESHTEEFLSVMTDTNFTPLPGERDIPPGFRWYIVTPYDQRYFIHIRSKVYCYNMETSRIVEEQATVTDEPHMIFLAVHTHGHAE